MNNFDKVCPSGNAMLHSPYAPWNDKQEDCGFCDNRGKVACSLCEGDGQYESYECGVCAGTGWVACPHCGE